MPSRAGAGASPDETTYADGCQWPSTRKASGWAPIVAQGDETDLNPGKAVANLPAGKYLISVTADGFKIDGAHFTVDGGTQTVRVQMNPTPLPLSTLRMTVFNNTSPVDATYEVDAEKGLGGFTAHLTDVVGTVSVDYYGNPRCTRYLRAGQTYYLVDENTKGALRRGELATIGYGPLRLRHVPVLWCSGSSGRPARRWPPAC